MPTTYTTASSATNSYYRASMSIVAIVFIVLGVITVVSIGCCIGGWIWIKRRRSRQAAAASEQQKAFMMNQPQTPYAQNTGGSYAPVVVQTGVPMYYPQQYPAAGYPAQQAPYAQGGI